MCYFVLLLLDKSLAYTNICNCKTITSSFFSVRFILENKTFEEPITVNEFENICSAEFGRFSQMLTDVCSDCKQNVSSVMFAGGSSRLQWFKRAVEKMSNF